MRDACLTFIFFMFFFGVFFLQKERLVWYFGRGEEEVSPTVQDSGFRVPKLFSNQRYVAPN